jgi:hypothetical protein
MSFLCQTLPAAIDVGAGTATKSGGMTETRLGIPAAMRFFCSGRISYGSVGHPTLYQVRPFNLLRMVSLPFDGLRAVSKVEPSNHKSSNYQLLLGANRRAAILPGRDS